MGGGGLPVRPKHLKKCLKLRISRGMGGGGSLEKSHPWGRYGYFRELHNKEKLKKKSIFNFCNQSINAQYLLTLSLSRLDIMFLFYTEIAHTVQPVGCPQSSLPRMFKYFER